MLEGIGDLLTCVYWKFLEYKYPGKFEFVYLGDSLSSQNKPATLYRFRQWTIRVETFDERATFKNPRQVEFWPKGQSQGIGNINAPWRAALMYTAEMIEFTPWFFDDEHAGGSGAGVLRGPTAPQSFPQVNTFPDRFEMPEL
jgi:hypothetical protein